MVGLRVQVVGWKKCFVGKGGCRGGGKSQIWNKRITTTTTTTGMRLCASLPKLNLNCCVQLFFLSTHKILRKLTQVQQQYSDKIVLKIHRRPWRQANSVHLRDIFSPSIPNFFFSRSVLQWGSSTPINYHPVGCRFVHSTTQFNWHCRRTTNSTSNQQYPNPLTIHLASSTPLLIAAPTAPRKDEHHSAHVNHIDAKHSLPSPMCITSCCPHLSSNNTPHPQVSPSASCLRLHFRRCNYFSMQPYRFSRVCDK